MPKNTVNTSIEFYYQGELYSTSMIIDLDRFMEDQTHSNPVSLLPVQRMLASKMGIGQYSYQYEILLEADIRFSQAQGLAARYLQDEHFDIMGFIDAWRENQILGQLQTIATRWLNIDDIGQQPALKNALLEAYRTGCADKH